MKGNKEIKSTAHSKYRHLVFAPKYRRQVIYGKIKADIGIMLRKLCEYKQVEIKKRLRSITAISYRKIYHTTKCH